MSLVFLDSTYKWCHTVSSFLCLTYFTYKHSGRISFFLVTGMIFHCAYLHSGSSHLHPGEMSILRCLPKIRRERKTSWEGINCPNMEFKLWIFLMDYFIYFCFSAIKSTVLEEQSNYYNKIKSLKNTWIIVYIFPFPSLQHTLYSKLLWRKWNDEILRMKTIPIPYSTSCLHVGNKGEERVQDGQSLNDQTGRM